MLLIVLTREYIKRKEIWKKGRGGGGEAGHREKLMDFLTKRKEKTHQRGRKQKTYRFDFVATRGGGGEARQALLGSPLLCLCLSLCLSQRHC